MAVGVESHDPGHDAEAQWQYDDDEFLRPKTERRLRETRPQDRQDADERAGDPEVGERPSDRPVVADICQPFGQLAEHRLHRALGIGYCRACRGRIAVDRGRRRQGPAEHGRHEVKDGHDHDQCLRARQQHQGRPHEGETEREGRVHGQGEESVRRKQLTARHEERNH